MKSIKPGRGPSMLGGVMSLLMGAFGIVWMLVVIFSGGGVFALFGLIFVIVAITQAVYHFKNATGENRYSSYDIVDSEEESDPWNERYGRKRSQSGEAAAPVESRFCPYCGNPVEKGYQYCNQCGEKLP
ncbi:MAG: zinc ribbon domain-containing protein [Oscillospiraceae bacterium]|nr:zinc ribbon domain-containing protein [Oscillospiraceae bacterium]